MKGHRTFTNKFGFLRLPEEGGFGQDMGGRWWIRAPGGDSRIVKPVDVLELPDGTITVSGYIEKGVWR